MLVHPVSPKLFKLKLEFKDEGLPSFIGDTQHGKVDNLDSQGLRKTNESLAKVYCKQSVSTPWASKLSG